MGGKAHIAAETEENIGELVENRTDFNIMNH